MDMITGNSGHAREDSRLWIRELRIEKHAWSGSRHLTLQKHEIFRKSNASAFPFQGKR
jgi:hypothetical protein